MKTKAWTTPLGIALIGGSVIALILGYVAGQKMQQDVAPDPFLNDQNSSFNESALIEENIDPAYRNDGAVADVVAKAPPPPPPPPPEPAETDRSVREAEPPAKNVPVLDVAPPSNALTNDVAEQ